MRPSPNAASDEHVFCPIEGLPPLPIIGPPPAPHLAPPIDAHEVLGGVLREQRNLIRAKGIKVSVRLLARNYNLPVNPERVRAIYRSLLRAAVESTEPGGRITIRSTCPSDEALRVEVEEKVAGGQIGSRRDEERKMVIQSSSRRIATGGRSSRRKA